MHEHAHVAGVGVHAVGNFERGETVPRAETLAAIVGALTGAGIEFTEDGVRIRPEALKRKRS
jgi:transcriptional regulator with XRE-family HTH domain